MRTVLALLVVAAVVLIASFATQHTHHAATPHHATCWKPSYAAAHNPQELSPAPRHGKGPRGVDVCDR